jgi:hypothetical protein
VCPADGIGRDPSHLEGSVSDIDSVAVPTNDLVFVAKIINVFIQGLHVMYTYDASVVFRGHILLLGNEEVPL